MQSASSRGCILLIQYRLQTSLSVLHAVNTDFDILAEEEDFIVVNKPAPLQVHPSTPNGIRTLWHGLRDLLAYELVNGGQISIINRLDRETSGLVLVAKNREAARLFGIAMQERRVHKTYQALVHGWPEWTETQCDGALLRKGDVTDSPIWVKQMVHEQGAASCTRFRCLLKTEHPQAGRLALVDAEPVTGRMHQIRVHLSHLGHPILGDKIYGRDERCYLDFIDTGWTADLASRLFFSRQALHSSRMSVDTALGSYAWQSPLPEDMCQWLPLNQS